MSSNARQRILVVDDHESVLEAFRQNLQDEDYCVDYFISGLKAYRHFSMSPSEYVMAFVDYNLLPSDEEFADGSTLIRRLKKLNEDLIVILISGDTSEEAYQKWLDADVDKVLYKPVSKQKIIASIRAAFAKYHNGSGPQKISSGDTDYAKQIGMVGASDDFQNTARNTLKYAEVDSDVLILGETGTGKELIAKAIHKNSKRAKHGNFVAINCASFKGGAHLMESELFGHERGAFTGAVATKIGVFEVAHGGTVFLDEIHHLGHDAQAKLLRALQERKIKRVGATKEFSVDFRLICAGKPKLKEMCKGADAEFLPDLFYRISNVDIVITPLRERPEDIMPLLMHFKNKVEEELDVKKEFSKSAMLALKTYNWPGNIRELENMIHGLYVTVEDKIIKRIHLSDDVLQAKSMNEAIAELNLEALETLQNMQIKKVILASLKKNEHNVKQAAVELKVKRTTLNSRMKSLGIFDSGPAERDGMLKAIIDNFRSFRM
ncbi:MAG: hypothetical protein A2X86_15965 [Bdellovibrionales bacterium GWA2_49_15]|nr:MAG: hypothetical protein A2X86_15965 [Bdellovibrionales bacterium GWA2_49_15]HAZ13180.1 hypothetical protein [Bdellovibrionales bacterium]